MRWTPACLWLGCVTMVTACGGDSTDPGRPVASVAVTPTLLELDSLEFGQLSAVAVDAAGSVVETPVTWSVVNEFYATVSTSGLVHGLHRGSTIASASAGGHSGAATVVIPRIADVGVAPKTLTLATGTTGQLTEVLFGSDGKPVTDGVRHLTWSSRSPAVATVGPTGIVTAVATGQAFVDGVYGILRDSMLVTVN